MQFVLALHDLKGKVRKLYYLVFSLDHHNETYKKCEEFKFASHNLSTVSLHLWPQGNLLWIIPLKWEFPTQTSHFLFQLYLKIINWRYCPVGCPPLVPLPESISGLWTEQLGSLFFLEVLDQWKCSISTCQVIASCEGQQGKNSSEWSQVSYKSQVQAVFSEIHKYTWRGTQQYT